MLEINSGAICGDGPIFPPEVVTSMDDGSQLRPAGDCPHVDLNDRRCGSRFSLGRIDQALAVCFGSYATCPMYHEINVEQRREQDAQVEIQVTVTSNGIQLPLRQTGT